MSSYTLICVCIFLAPSVFCMRDTSETKERTVIGEYDTSGPAAFVITNKSKVHQRGIANTVWDIYETINYLQTTPLVQGTMTIKYGIDAFYVVPKTLSDKSGALDDIERKLVVSDLSTAGLAEADVAREIDELRDTFDISQSLTAFKNALSREEHLLREALDKDKPPASYDECKERFSGAEVALTKELCDAACASSVEAQKCSTVLLKGHHWRRALPDLTDLSEESCKSLPEETSFATWSSMVGEAVKRFEHSLAENFVSPAVMALSTQVTMLQMLDVMVEKCAEDSSQTNLLGKAAHGLRRMWQGRANEPVVARDIILAKSAQVREYISKISCPALQSAGCKAGCENFCGDSSQEAAEDTTFKQAHCSKLREFKAILQPVCENSGKPLGKVVTTVINYVSDLTSIQGLAGLTALVVLWNNPEMLMDTNTMYNAVGAMSSVAWLFQRTAQGWKDASETCNNIARQFLNATAANDESSSFLAFGSDERVHSSALVQHQICGA